MKNYPCAFAVVSLLSIVACEEARAAIQLDATNAVALGGASLPPGRGVVGAGEGAETAARAFDGVSRTTWAVKIPEGETSWIEYRFDDDVCWLLTEYSVANGIASETRDPREWELQGSNDGETWVTIDARKRQFFASRQSVKSTRVRPQEAFNRYRLRIAGNANGLIEVGEVGLVVKAVVLPPSVPTAEVERGGMALRWEPVENATGYTVRRAKERTGPYALLASGVKDTRYLDAGPFPDSELSYYTISAELDGRCGPLSVPAGAATPVGAPMDLRIKQGVNNAVLEWTPAPRAIAYVVKRSLVPEGPYAAIASRITSPGFTDEGLSAGTAYHYVVCGVAHGKEGVESAPVSALFPPLAPTGLTAEPGKECVALKWNAVALAKSYKVFRATSAEAPKEEVSEVTDGTTFTDAELDFKKTYYYTVAAVNDCGASASATPVSATPIRPPSWWRR